MNTTLKQVVEKLPSAEFPWFRGAVECWQGDKKLWTQRSNIDRVSKEVAEADAKWLHDQIMSINSGSFATV